MKEIASAISGGVGWQLFAQLLLFIGIVGSGLYVVLERAYKQRINFLKETIEEYKSSLDEKVERRTAEIKKQLEDTESLYEDFDSLLRSSIEIIIREFGDIIEKGNIDLYLSQASKFKDFPGSGIDDSREQIANFFSQVYSLSIRYDENLAKNRMRDIRRSMLDQKLI